MIANTTSSLVFVLCSVLVSSCGASKKAEPTGVEIQWPDAGRAAAFQDSAAPSADGVDEPDAMPQTPKSAPESAL